MPVLPPPIKALVSNARFTVADMVALRKAIRNQQASIEDAKAIATHFIDTLEPGVGSWLRNLLKENRVNLSLEQPIANLAQETSLLIGQIVLPESGRRHPSVKYVQRALMALASRTGELDYMLSQFGADGDYGNETTNAVKLFQRNNNLPVTGKVDAKTANAIDQALRQTKVPGIFSATPDDLVTAAIELTTEPVALSYGVEQPWVNIDPQHNVPVDRPFRPLAGRWKCNLFGGNVLRKGGYEPPYYGNQGKGEYPNANQWYKWTDKYAASLINKVHFQLIDEIDFTTLPATQQEQRINQLLSQVKPGDFLMADHIGQEIADGGHTRVATASHFAIDKTVDFAQAHFEKAVIEREGFDQLMNEEKIWLMRPNRQM